MQQRQLVERPNHQSRSGTEANDVDFLRPGFFRQVGEKQTQFARHDDGGLQIR